MDYLLHPVVSCLVLFFFFFLFFVFALICWIYLFILLLLLWGFSTLAFRVFFHNNIIWVSCRRSLSVSRSPPIPTTHLSNLTDLDNVVIWKVSIIPLISNSSSTFFRPWGIIQCLPTTIGNTTFFFWSQARSKYLSMFLFSLIFLICSQPEWQNPLDDKCFSLYTSCKFFLISIILIIIIYPASLSYQR